MVVMRAAASFLLLLIKDICLAIEALSRSPSGWAICCVIDCSDYEKSGWEAPSEGALVQGCSCSEVWK